MRIIDILNKKAEKRLKDGERFVYDNKVFIYDKEEDTIRYAVTGECLGYIYKVENILLGKVEFIITDDEEE